MFYVPYTTANPTTYLFLEKSNPSRHQQSANALGTIHKYQNFVSWSTLIDKTEKVAKTRVVGRYRKPRRTLQLICFYGKGTEMGASRVEMHWTRFTKIKIVSPNA